MEDEVVSFDLGIKPSSSKSSASKVPLISAAKKATVPAARVGETLASGALGGLIPSAALGAGNFVSNLVLGENALPALARGAEHLARGITGYNQWPEELQKRPTPEAIAQGIDKNASTYEDIYNNYIPSLRTLSKGATSAVQHAGKAITGQKPLSEEQEKYYSEFLPDVGPLASPERIREQVTKPHVGFVTEPEGIVEEALSGIGNLAGALAKPNTWTSARSMLTDLLKSAGKSAVIKGAGKVGETAGGPVGGTLAELLTMGAVGAAEQKGLVAKTKADNYKKWDSFVSDFATIPRADKVASGTSTIAPFPAKPFTNEVNKLLRYLRSGLGKKSPAKTDAIDIANRAKKSLKDKPTPSQLNEIRKDINTLYDKVGEEGRHNLGRLDSIVDKHLERWSNTVPGGKEAYKALQEANTIHQGQLITGKLGDMFRLQMSKGNLPYASAIFGIQSPGRAWKMLNTEPIRNLWIKAWQEGAQDKIKAAQRTLGQFDSAIAKKFPNILEFNA